MALTRTGSGYVNLGKYLSANAGNNLNDAIGQKVQGVGQGLQNQVNTSVSNLKEETEKNRLDRPENVEQRDTAIQNVGTLIDPSKVDQAVTPELEEKFNTFRSGEYKGPTDVKDRGAIEAKQQEVQGLNKDLTTLNPSSRFNLLNRYISNPTYGIGQASLDSAFINKGKLKPYTSSLQQAPEAVNRQLAQGQGSVASAQAGSQQFGLDTTKQITDKATAIQKNLADKKLLAKTPDQALTEAKAAGDLSKYGIDFKPLGPGSDAYFGVDPNTYYSKSGVDPTLQNLATPEDYAKYEALTRLGGTTNDVLTDPTQAGLYDPNKLVSFDKNGFNTTVNTNKQDYITKEAQLENDLNQAIVDALTTEQRMNEAEAKGNNIFGMRKNEIRGGEAAKATAYAKINAAVAAQEALKKRYNQK